MFERSDLPPFSKQRLGASVLLLFGLILLCASCNRDDMELSKKYPDYVAKIIRRNCSIAGCHTAKSAEAAAGLNLETWEDLFKGANGGSPVIPYSPDQSYFLYAINTDTTLGPTLSPTMPIGKPALSRQEYLDLKQWILEGARNEDGKERFPADPGRRKWYVANKGCDRVAVVDAESKQIMRYLEVGANPLALELPHALVMAPDQRSFYVVFSMFSPHIEQYSTLTDEKIASISLGHNGWNSMCISPDGKWGFVVGEQMREVLVLDLTTNQIVAPLVTTFQDVHGPVVHPVQRKLYLPQPLRSGMYVMTYDQMGVLGNPTTVELVQGINPAQPGNLWPYKIVFSPDASKYFVACRNSNEVRVFNALNDSLIQVVQVGDFPVDMAVSAATGHLLVACQEDTTFVTTSATMRGSVAVINLQSGQLLRSLYTGFQPGAVGIDPVSGLAVVANRNLLGNYSGQHHPSPCGGVNGYLTMIDLQNLELVNGYKYELLADPASVAVKQ
jgi:DNA-binding beta-propeller fold protein YncE